MSQKCLVLGANGFVGSHIVDELVAKRCEVIAFDRFSRDPQFDATSNVEVVKGDFFDDILLHELFQKADYILHAFSATTPFTADADPYSDINLNVMRNIQIFEKAVECGIKKIGYISSGGAVYGNVPANAVLTEESTPRPVSPYGIGKLATEYYLAYFQRKYGLSHTIYRLSNPYGPRQVQKHNQGVIPIFTEKIQKDQPIVMYGDGTSSRDYIYIRDATAMIVDSFFADSNHVLYNIGSGRQTDINTIVSELESILGKKAIVEHKEPPKTFLERTDISIDRFIGEFGERQLLTLKEGLKRTFNR